MISKFKKFVFYIDTLGMSDKQIRKYKLSKNYNCKKTCFNAFGHINYGNYCANQVGMCKTKVYSKKIN